MYAATNHYGTKTLLFLAFVGGWILYGILCAAFFVVVSAISWFLPDFMAVGLWALVVMGFLGVILTVVIFAAIILRKEPLPFISVRYILMKYIVPVARSFAKRTGFNADKVVWSFIVLSNDFILNQMKGRQINNIMLLLPHCIQLHSCGMKLTSDITNCKKCGKCVISSLIELSDSMAVYISVASGGTMARKQLAEKRPALVLAVACERDLLSGIRDTLPMPVIGVINQRPEGPCVNTTVDIGAIAQLINKIKN